MRMSSYQKSSAVKLQNAAKKNGKRVGKPFTSGYDARRNTKGRPPLNQSLGERIRRIGFEIADKKTRSLLVDKVIRSLYARAARGSVNAAALLFVRGWGRAPFESEINFDVEVEQLKKECEEAGIDWKANPVLSSIFESLTQRANSECFGVHDDVANENVEKAEKDACDLLERYGQGIDDD